MEYVSPIDDRTAEPRAVRAAARARSPGGASPCSTSRRTAAASCSTGSSTTCDCSGAETFRLSKEIFSKPASSEVIEQVAIHGDLAVEGLAD